MHVLPLCGMLRRSRCVQIFLSTQPLILTRMTLDPGAPGGSGWTFGLSPVVSAMLSGVVGACGLYVVVCVAGAPMCITVTFFFNAARF